LLFIYILIPSAATIVVVDYLYALPHGISPYFLYGIIRWSSRPKWPIKFYNTLVHVMWWY